MKHSFSTHVRHYGLRVAPLLFLAAALVWNAPVQADYRRSCHIVVEVTPEQHGLEPVIYSFRVFNTVDRYVDVNHARRNIRGRVVLCLQTHWSNRDRDSRPPECEDTRRIEMGQYPFDNMFAQIRGDICRANPSELRLNVDVELFIRGKRGCLEHDEARGVVDPAAYYVIAPNVRINCPISDGGSSGSYDPRPTPPDRPPLAGIRLPGHDIGTVDVGEGDWQACWSACEANDACRAWTYRNFYRGVSSVCLLKSGAGAQVPDACCHSGIME